MKDDRREAAVHLVKLYLDTARIVSTIVTEVGFRGHREEVAQLAILVAFNMYRFDKALAPSVVRIDTDMLLEHPVGEFDSVEDFTDKLREYKQLCEKDLATVREHYGIVVQ